MADNYTPLDTIKLGQLATGTAPASLPQTHRPSPEAAPIPVIPVAKPAQTTESQPQEELTKDPEQVSEEPVEETPPVSQFVQEVKDDIEVPPELQKIGLKPANTSNAAYQNVKLPISDEKVMEGLEKSPMTSHRWLAELCRYMLRLAHIQLKKVHGHVVRVFKP